MTKYSKDGLYNLTPWDIFQECQRCYGDFFSDQTPIKVFRLSIALYHLLEWIYPDANSPKVLRSIEKKASDDRSAAEHFVYELGNDLHYKVVASIANNSKHHTLTRSESHEKGEVNGFRAGRSVAGERLGQRNLTVSVDGSEVWLREVFYSVLSRYDQYFKETIS